MDVFKDVKNILAFNVYPLAWNIFYSLKEKGDNMGLDTNVNYFCNLHLYKLLRVY